MSEKNKINGYGEFEGVVVEVGAIKKFGANGFQKRDVVVVDDPGATYPSYAKFFATGERCALFNGVKAGDKVKVRFVVVGRKWDSPDRGVMYFTDLKVIGATVWKAEKQPTVAAESKPEASPDVSASGDGELDELPF